MKEKIKSIKLILSTILLALLIISIFKSCSYAYTLEDFKNFCQYTKDNNINSNGSNYNNARNQFLNIYSLIENKLGKEIDDFNNFYLYHDGSAKPYCLFLINGSINYSCNSNNNTIITNNLQSELTIKKLKWANGINNINSFNYETITTINLNANTFCLFDGSPTNSNYYNTLMQNQWCYCVLRGNISNNTYLIKNLPWVIADIKVAYGLNYNNIGLYLNNEYVGNYQILENYNDSSGILYQFAILNTLNKLINNSTYNIQIKDNNNGTLLTSEDFILKWINDENSSGENSSGNIIVDLTETNQKLDNINNSINNTNQLLISGEKKAEERQSFWEKAYNTMFIPSGDKIETKINELKEHIGISGDISGELLILNNIKNNSGDFIIKWDKMSTHFSIKGQLLQNQLNIPSGEINFSKIERENEAFQNTMEWVRALLGFSLIVLLIKQWWTLVLKTLGISTQVYEQHIEEQERLQKTQETKESKK